MVERLVSRVSGLFLYLAGGTTVVLVVFVMTDVLLRYLLRRPLGFADEVGGYLLAAIVFLGAAGAQRDGKHINVEVIYDWLVRRLGGVARLAIDLASLVIVAGLTWQAVALVLSSYTWGARSMGVLHTPMWFPQVPLALGLGALWFQVFAQVLRSLREARSSSGKRRD